MVEVEADELRSSLANGRNGVATGVLQLLNQVLLRVGCKGGALGGVQVHVVSPDLEGVGVEVVGKVLGQVEIEADLSVLQRDEGQEETGVAVEEEDQRQMHTEGAGGVVATLATANAWSSCSGHLVVQLLVGISEEYLSIQTPPGLVVLVNLLTTDGQGHILNGTLGNPAHVGVHVVGGEAQVSQRALGGEAHLHVAHQIAVTSDNHRQSGIVASAAVHGLLDGLHGKVGVLLISCLEEGDSGGA